MKKKYVMLSLLLSGIPFAAFVGAQDTLTINFTGMDTLNNQQVYLSVFDVRNNTEIGRSTYMVGTMDSSLAFEGITAGGPYYVDLFVDKNNNGKYDAPPVDQAWRIVLDSLAGGDTTITFAYNDTAYMDIMWRNRLRLAFTAMDTLVGKDLYVSLRNQDGDRQINVDTVKNITAEFNHDFYEIKADSSYQVVFFADMDNNAKYDTSDFAWLIYLDHLRGDTVIPFSYNTDYANNIDWMEDSTDNNPNMTYSLIVNFSQMSENVGKTLKLFLKEMENTSMADSITMTVDSAEFIVIFDSLMTSTDYNLDFYADMNGNNAYDAPPTDQAWRIPLTNIQGDTIINFIHNTDYVDIMNDTTGGNDSTNYMIKVQFTGYTTNVGQNFTVYLKDPDNNAVLDSVYITPLDTSDFTIEFDSVVSQTIYNIDFYVDANSNGSYDTPPTDQSWRITVNNIVADTTINFIYDTNYTDITIIATGVGEVDQEAWYSVYPNPVQHELTVDLQKGASELRVYTLTGALVLQHRLMPSERVVKLNVSDLKPGMYILRLNDGSKFSQHKFLKD